MSERIRRECSSVGSDESGTGGLFGESVFVGVKLTKSLLQIIQQLPWFQKVEKIKDSKDFSEKECIELSRDIEKVLIEGKDFVVEYLEIYDHNKIWKKYKDSTRSKCICHNLIHKKLNEDTTFHVVDNFLGKNTEKYLEVTQKSKAIPIDKFCIKGEKQILSISLASIIARGRYLKNFYKLMQQLGIELNDTINHNLSPSKIEPMLSKLEKQGYKREYVLNTFCKEDVLKKYESKLIDYLSSKTSH